MEDNGYIRSLDGVRAIAILLVMTFHTELTSFGWVGVQLFFVLSGFLITRILWKEKSKEGESLFFKFKKFWVRRSLRIFPLYYAYIFLIGLIYLLVGFPSYFETYFPYIVSYTANFPLVPFENLGNPLFNHLWSLSIEEQFYFIFPLFIFLSPKKIIKKLLLVIIFISPIIRFLIGEYYKSKGLSELTISNGVNFNTLCQLDAFCLGGIISVFSLDSFLKRPILIFSIVLGATFITGIFNYLNSPNQLNYFLDLGYHHYHIGNYQHIWQYTILDVLFASFILVLVSKNSRTAMPLIRKILENKWMVSIGKVSYGMYIFHWLIWVYLFTKLFHPESYWMKALLFLPYLLLVYIVSALTFKFFELYFIRLKDKFFPPSNTPSISSASATSSK